MSKIISGIFGILIGVFIVAVLLLYGAFAWGFVISIFWEWFIMPVFKQMPFLTIMQATGIAMVTGILTHKHTQKIKDEYENKSYAYIEIILPWLSLLIGWFIHLFY